MRRAITVLALLASGCGEAVRDDHFANDVESAPVADAPVRTEAVPVRIGELGPNFAACSAAGTTRHLDPAKGELLPVQAAPFESADRIGGVPAGSRFFVCTRSHDQRWLGIIWPNPADPAADCGVSSPISARRDYAGPCRSGWVASVFVKLSAV